MNFEGFKKTHSDGKTTILKHAKGHMIRIVHGALSPSMKDELDELPHYAEGGEVDDEEINQDHSMVPTPEELSGPSPLTPDQSSVLADPVQAPVQGISPLADQYQSYAPGATQGSESGLAQGTAPTPEAPAAAPQQQVPSGVGLMEAGIRNQAKAEGNLGKAQAAILGDQAKQSDEADTVYQMKDFNLAREQQAYQEDIKNGTINPERYYGNMSTGSKIATAIGLVLGGLGGGATGKENPAAVFLQKQIDNDIMAQKAELGKKENLLSMSLKMTGNLRDAEQLTQAKILGATKVKLEQAMAAATDPIAKARAQQALGQIQQSIGSALAPIQQKQQLIADVNSGKAPPEAILNMLSPADQTKGAEEIKRATEGREKLKATLEAFDTVNEAATPGYALQNPRRAWSGAQKAQLNGAIAELNKTLTGRFNNEENKKLFEQFAPNITDTAEDRALKRANLEKYASMGMNDFTVLKKNGINPQIFMGAAQPAQPQNLTHQDNKFIQWARANPNDPRAQQVLQRNGMK